MAHGLSSGAGADWLALASDIASSEAEWGVARLRRPQQVSSAGTSIRKFLGLQTTSQQTSFSSRLGGQRVMGFSRHEAGAEGVLFSSAALRSEEPHSADKARPGKRLHEDDVSPGQVEDWKDTSEILADEGARHCAEGGAVKEILEERDGSHAGVSLADGENGNKQARVEAEGAVSGSQEETKEMLVLDEAHKEGTLGSDTPQQEQQVVAHRQGSNTSAILAQLPGWNLVRATGIMETFVGKRFAGFVEDVVAVSQAHEQRFSRLTLPETGAVDTGSERPRSTSSLDLQTSSFGANDTSTTGGDESYRGTNGGSQAWHERVSTATVDQLGSWLARVRTTLRGSSQDIGWLLREPEAQPITDGTERFNKILGRVRNGVHTLPDSYVYLLVPGLFSNLGPLYFMEAKRHLAQLGLNARIAKIHSEAAIETNARELCQLIEELHWGTAKQVVILGHSKGGVDSCAALAMFPERLQGKVRGVVLLQSPYAGSPLASDLLREGQVGDAGSRAILQSLMSTVLKGDLMCLEDLTYIKRRAFLTQHRLPPGLPTVCFHTECDRAPAAISALTTVANAEIPLATAAMAASRGAGRVVAAADGSGGRAVVPVLMPIAGALAAVAGHLELRYGEKSDGLVTRKDAEVPGCVVVRPTRKMDHGWLVFGGRKTPGEADAAQVSEALLTLLLESDFYSDGRAPSIPSATP